MKNFNLNKIKNKFIESKLTKIPNAELQSAIQQTKEQGIIEKTKFISLMALSVFIALWALCGLLFNPFGAIVLAVAAVIINPYVHKLLKQKNIFIKMKHLAIATAITFLIGTSFIFSSVEPSSDSQEIAQIEETVEEATQELEVNVEVLQTEESKSEVIEEVAAEEVETEPEEIENVETEAENKVEEVDSTTVEAEIAEEITETEENIVVAEEDTSTVAPIGEMTVHFLNMDQSDSTLIICDGEAMLIDAGTSDKGTAIQSYLMKQGIKSLKYLVLTHPDADHIGGAHVIITKFGIDNLFMSNFTKTNKTYTNLIDTINYKGLKWSTPSVGSTYNLGSASFQILGPNRTYSEPNNASIALRISLGNNSFLFTGDAETEAESDIVNTGLTLSSTVYQVGHHGSRTASSTKMLNAVNPTYAVISCGEGNSYGHPHAETMNNLRAMGVQVFRTDEQGTVVATANGTEIKWNMSPSDTWKAGEPTGDNNSGGMESSTPSPVENAEATGTQEQAIASTITGGYAVNNKNGKIHMVGQCPATGSGDGAMSNPSFFNTYEEAEAYSIQIKPNQDKRKCGNCW